jgi:Cu/Ag efflux protein CusF
MRSRGGRDGFHRCAALILLAGGLAFTAGCQTQDPEKHYALRGRVVSKDVSAQQITVDNENIPGFMPAMTMPYPVKDPQGLDAVQPGDKITADVVVQSKDAYFLQHLTITDREWPRLGSGGAPRRTNSHPATAVPDVPHDRSGRQDAASSPIQGQGRAADLHLHAVPAAELFVRSSAASSRRFTRSCRRTRTT